MSEPISPTAVECNQAPAILPSLSSAESRKLATAKFLYFGILLPNLGMALTVE
jgi:hypothetical protein